MKSKKEVDKALEFLLQLAHDNYANNFPTNTRREALNAYECLKEYALTKEEITLGELTNLRSMD